MFLVGIIKVFGGNRYTSWVFGGSQQCFGRELVYKLVFGGNQQCFRREHKSFGDTRDVMHELT